ncbi:hypothetical protein DFR29_10165 [Tahibacter aquaticus]|uniref:DNA-binding beta-propeller fold protein YncE n=1 Tax=Tahibacter aquaticus TaxID=520092 RepID=A0A4R6Z9B6_9GAMM|nr:hypothetical protein [Tahibacter aquaticus]TDR48445.1 hypothetical protein DFR29_10165 [Tahibacter aquaticus]
MSNTGNGLGRWAVLISLFLFLSCAQAQDCKGVRVLVSGYYSNVHVYDACTGQFLRNLDDSGRIQGAQAVKAGPDGKLWVVSEGAGTILRYDLKTLAFSDTFASVGAPFGVTGLAFTNDGDVYLGSYSTSALRRYSIATGASENMPLAGLSLLKGPDNGLIYAPQGELLIPGYDSNNVVGFNLATRSYRQLVAPRADGLRATRGLLLSLDATKLYVTGERSNQILRYNYPSGTLDKVISTSINTPTGIAWFDPTTLLVAGSGSMGSGVLKIDAETGEEKSLFIRVGAGGLSGPTYIAVVLSGLDPDPQPNARVLGSQYWVTALGRLSGTTVDMEAHTAVGGSFGEDFDPSFVTKPRWGSISLNFLSCTEAEMRWTSTGEDSGNFGSGGYRIQRNLSNPQVAACQRTGIAGTPDSSWLQGAWYGGPSRDGEGFVLDTDGNGLVFLTWFTYRPFQQQLPDGGSP